MVKQRRGMATGYASAIQQLGKQAAKKALQQLAGKAVKTVSDRVRKAITRTKTKTQQKQNSRAQMAAKSAQKGQYQGKFSRRPTRSQWGKFTARGAVGSKETGVLATGVSNTMPLYVGHSTHGDGFLMRKLYFRAAIREIFYASGNKFTSFDDFPGVFTLFAAWMQGDANNAESQSGYPTSGKTFEQLADNLDTTFGLLYDSLTGQTFLYLKSLRLVYGVAPNEASIAKVEFQDVYVHVMAKSDLKIQNRTVAVGVDDDANSTENVANQPLYGKGYECRGNGLVAKYQIAGGSQAKSLICANNNGTLAYAPPATEIKTLGEPPLPTYFTPLPKFFNASLEPGAIKTSSLTKTCRIKNTDFWRMNGLRPNILPNNSAKSGDMQNRYGLCKIFALEKNICATSGDTVPILGMEHNLRMGLYFSRKRKTDVQEIFEGQSFLLA